MIKHISDEEIRLRAALTETIKEMRMIVAGIEVALGEQEPVAKNMTLACPSHLHDYTTPPQRTWVGQMKEGKDFTINKPWVGLTDEEIDQGLLRSDYAFKTAEAWRAGVVFAMTKLKEKNCG